MGLVVFQGKSETTVSGGSGRPGCAQCSAVLMLPHGVALAPAFERKNFRLVRWHSTNLFESVLLRSRGDQHVRNQIFEPRKWRRPRPREYHKSAGDAERDGGIENTNTRYRSRTDYSRVIMSC